MNNRTLSLVILLASGLIAAAILAQPYMAPYYVKSDSQGVVRLNKVTGEVVACNNQSECWTYVAEGKFVASRSSRLSELPGFQPDN